MNRTDPEWIRVLFLFSPPFKFIFLPAGRKADGERRDPQKSSFFFFFSPSLSLSFPPFSSREGAAGQRVIPFFLLLFSFLARGSYQGAPARTAGTKTQRTRKAYFFSFSPPPPPPPSSPFPFLIELRATNIAIPSLPFLRSGWGLHFAEGFLAAGFFFSLSPFRG